MKHTVHFGNCFRPLSGNYLFILSFNSLKELGEVWFPSPFGELSIYTLAAGCELTVTYRLVSVPFRGTIYLYLDEKNFKEEEK